MNTSKILLGCFLIAIGVIVIMFGDRPLSKETGKGGIILKLFSQPALNVKVLKWVTGIMAIWFGLSLVLIQGHH